MMLLPRIDPPGGLDEMSAEAAQAWSDRVSKFIEDARPGHPGRHDGPREHFYNPTLTDTAADAAEKQIFWFAFPRILLLNSAGDRDRWESADAERESQDEYCEWSVQKSGRKVIRVTFTTETPEYFETLAKFDPDRLLALYRECVSPDVQLDDLIEGGTYVRDNIWNSDTTLGPMHLIQTNNNLGAAVELAAAATIVREINGKILTAQGELIECSKYGDEQRNSDPHIGAEVNALARAGADVTLANPPGLYVSMLSTAGWVTPDGSDPLSFWTWRRGGEGMRLRAVYEVPADKGYVVGDIKINGLPIEFGGQIADFVTVKLRGLACSFGQSTTPASTVCKT